MEIEIFGGLSIVNVQTIFFNICYREIEIFFKKNFKLKGALCIICDYMSGFFFLSNKQTDFLKIIIFHSVKIFMQSYDHAKIIYNSLGLVLCSFFMDLGVKSLHGHDLAAKIML